jgi:hypothetical protein
MIKGLCFYILLSTLMCPFCGCFAVDSKQDQIQSNKIDEDIDCEYLSGTWQLNIAQRDNTIKLCDGIPCEGESFQSPVYFECKNGIVKGKLLRVVSMGEEKFSDIEISFLKDEVVMVTNTGSCDLKLMLKKNRESLTGKYNMDCKSKNIFPRKEGNVMLLRVDD